MILLNYLSKLIEEFFFSSTEMLPYHFIRSRILFQKRCKESQSVPLHSNNIGISFPSSFSLSITICNWEFTGFNSKRLVHGQSHHHKRTNKQNHHLQGEFFNPQFYSQQNSAPFHSKSSKTVKGRRAWRKMFPYFGIFSPVRYTAMFTNCVRWEQGTEGKDMDHLVQTRTVNITLI